MSWWAASRTARWTRVGSTRGRPPLVHCPFRTLPCCTGWTPKPRRSWTRCPGPAFRCRSARMIGCWTGRVSRPSPASCASPTLDETTTLNEAAPFDEADIFAAVDLLTPLAARCGDDLPRFLTELATGAEVDTWDPRADRITLLTLHAAKGLEFPVVFLVGCEDGLLPLRLPGRPPSDDEVDGERRLFSVGSTRAQDRLFVSHTRRRFRHGAERQMAPSPFLAAIDQGLLERRGDDAPRRPRDQQLRLL